VAGAALALLVGTACAGYRVIGPDAGGGRTLAVPLTANDTMWVGLEAPLTRALRADAQRLLDVELTSERAALRLTTRLRDPHRLGRVGLRGGAYALGAAAVEVDWELLDAGGAVLAQGVERRELEFVTSLEETDRAAYDQIFQQIAEKIVLDVAAWLDAAAAGPNRTEA
jgi:hypothetical protein